MLPKDGGGKKRRFNDTASRGSFFFLPRRKGLVVGKDLLTEQKDQLVKRQVHLRKEAHALEMKDYFSPVSNAPPPQSRRRETAF